MNVAVILVNYGNANDLEKFVRSQSNLLDYVTLVIVDNTGVRDRDLVRLHSISEHSRGRLVLAENPGYFGGVRAALAELPWLLQSTYLIVGNADLDFDINAYAAHLTSRRATDRSKGVGILAPRLVGHSGLPVRQLHLTSSPSANGMRRTGRILALPVIGPMRKRLGDVVHRYRDRKINRVRHGLSLGMPERTLFAPHGALMIFTREYLRTDGPFDHACFLYGEEVFVGLHAKRHGLICVFAPELTYTHKGHGSMGKWPSRRVMLAMSEAHEWASRALASTSTSG